MLTTEDEADRVWGSAKTILGLASGGGQSGQKVGRGERSSLFAYVHGGRGQGFAVS